MRMEIEPVSNLVPAKLVLLVRVLRLVLDKNKMVIVVVKPNKDQRDRKVARTYHPMMQTEVTYRRNKISLFSLFQPKLQPSFRCSDFSETLPP